MNRYPISLSILVLKPRTDLKPKPSFIVYGLVFAFKTWKSSVLETPPEGSACKLQQESTAKTATSTSSPMSTVEKKKKKKSVSKVWMMSGSCVRGDLRSYLHSWFYGDGLSKLSTLHGHNQVSWLVTSLRRKDYCLIVVVILSFLWEKTTLTPPVFF